MGKYEAQIEDYELEDLKQDDYELEDLEEAYYERTGTEQGYLHEEEDDLNAADAGFIRGYMEA